MRWKPQLKVLRIDHGVRCTEDPALVEELAAARIPLRASFLPREQKRRWMDAVDGFAALSS